MLQTQTQSGAAPTNDTALAFSYLVLFRRFVVSLAFVGAGLAWTYELPALTAALVCIGIGELLESSYYLNVLRWRYGEGAERDPLDPSLNGPPTP